MRANETPEMKEKSHVRVMVSPCDIETHLLQIGVTILYSGFLSHPCAFLIDFRLFVYIFNSHHARRACAQTRRRK